MMTFAADASVEDMSQTLAGIVAFTPLLLVTGYLVNRATGVLVRRDACMIDTLGASLALSVSVLPVFLHLLGRISMAGTRVVFWASAVAFAVIIWRKRRGFFAAITWRSVRWCLLAALLWIAVSVAVQIDLQWHNRVYPSSIIVDQALRIGTVGAVNRSTVLPPEDPFLRLGAPAPLGYHYFWYVLCDLVCREAPNWIGTRGALMAGTTWTGLALWASLSLWLRSVRGEREWTQVRWVVAALLLGISGLDVLAGIALIFRAIVWHSRQWLPFPTLDWWTVDQITNWFDIMVWVPHCAASLVACATGLLILLQCADAHRKRQLISILVAGACFASAAGMSIYVAFGFAIGIGSYLILLLVRKEGARVIPFVVSGAVAAMLAAPFLIELHSNVASPDFLQIGLRELSSNTVPKTFKNFLGNSPRYLTFVPGLAATLFIELGFWVVAATYWWRMQKQDPKPFRTWLLVLLFASSLILTTFVRSSLTNDLGMRAIFCGQFALAVMGGEWMLRRCTEPRLRSVLNQLRTLPRFALLLLVLGLSTTMAEAALLRTYPMFQDLHMVDYEFIRWPNIGASVASTRSAYEWLKKHSDPDALVQLAPSDNALYFVGGYSERQTAVTGSYQLNFRAKYRSALEFAMEDIEKVFRDSGASPSDFASICSRWGISYLVITSHDPVWDAATGSGWHISPMYKDKMARVYSCSAMRSR